VHTGVHYPGDIVVGSLIGEGTGQVVAGLMDRLSPPGGRHPARKQVIPEDLGTPDHLAK
jgi:undecaprenyl-diphosphatase